MMLPCHGAALRLVALVVAALSAGCASLPTGGLVPADDPLEPVNRVVFSANVDLDRIVIAPAAEVYRAIVPAPVRDGIRHAVDNFAEPRIFVNDLLQRRPEGAGMTLARFFINSTAGVGGLFDPATAQGYPRQSGDFGQTLSTWGVMDGPYLVLPLFGPSNLRDAFGLAVDIYTTPPALVVQGPGARTFNIVFGVADGIDLRARNLDTLEEIKKSAIDLYAHIRSLARQRRQAELREASGHSREPDELVDPGAPAR